ncbi:hypothetical protein V6N13_020220 [Hibiscus sabdariffa]|uniref:Chromatin assembly factor 1 subunit A dimerization domain-containing protein n=1 Tax=Hibiscus sabdariffa TaxID=183260 RepID=A0ABR2EVJ1_9ROSI
MLLRSIANVVRPQCPWRKDPDLDYDVDSDEEWDEEEPGESLSDCEKDEEEETDEGCSLHPHSTLYFLENHYFGEDGKK